MSKRLGTDKDVQAIAEKARSADWTVEHTRGQHLRFTPPRKDLPIIIFAMSSSDWRAIKDLRARLRRAGLEV